MEPQESDHVKSIKVLSEMNHEADRRKLLSMTIENHGSEKELIVERGSPLTIKPPDEEILEKKKILPITKNTKMLTRTKLYSPETLRYKQRVKELKKFLRKFITEREDIKPLLGMHSLRDFKGRYKTSKVQRR